MRILLWHGYLLSGSGSNIYTANVARAWRALGHDVVLMCQETDVARFDFLDEQGIADRATAHALATNSEKGRCVLLRPPIGEVLPVYVYDEYEGFTAKRFVDLSEGELTRYTESNVAAMTAVIEEMQPDAIVTGHEVMGPFISRLACEATGTDFIAKLHGSALEYAVKIQDRYLDYATRGLNAAKRVIGGSRYMLDAAAAVVPGRWRDEATVVNPGCDVELFKPADRHAPERPAVAFVGKLIVSKGVHHLLASVGLTRAGPMEVVVVGFGGFEEQLKSLAAALADGDAEHALALAETGDSTPLEALASFLVADPGPGYWKRQSEVPITFAGRLEHGPLSERLPYLDVLVVPSVRPEAFGMVAAEAAACGVLPIVPGHSGIGEVGAALEEHLGIPGLLTFDPAAPIEGIAAAIDRILGLGFDRRRELGLAAAELTRSRWSWETVAERLLAAATD
ncbi:MAG: glycosyltransferase family 4 protein [Actinomycetota bacterium]